MGKDLSEMTLEELWELFPIFLVEHDDRWKDFFDEVEKTLTRILSEQPVERISHIGSSSRYVEQKKCRGKCRAEQQKGTDHYSDSSYDICHMQLLPNNSARKIPNNPLGRSEL